MPVLQKEKLLKVEDLGLIPYSEAWAYQQKSVQEVINGETQKLILCEHPPVLTLGRLADKKNILYSAEELAKQGIECFSIDRGGDVTLHSPGQLVIYPILDLNSLEKDLKWYWNKLEQVAIDLLKDFDIMANRISGKTGVWASSKKIVSLGIGVRKWVTYHGLGINVNTDLKLFSVIRPCGMDVAMTSMAELKSSSLNMEEVKRKTVAVFCQNFNIHVHA